MSEAFERALAFILAWEGDGAPPDDPGGRTRFGISHRAHPGLDISALTPEQARALYRRDYWQRLRCDELPPPVALALMDSAVNCGRRRAVQWLQAALNELERPPRLAVDGLLGPRTLRAARYHAPRAALLAHRLLMRRLGFYSRLARRDPYRAYLRGWVCRVVALSAMLGGTP